MISSKWILGFAGATRPKSDGEWYDTFVGGQPVYPENLNVCTPPCPLCGASRKLVLQAFAPHNSHSERAIYLFGCNSIKCALNEKSWLATRLCKEMQTSGTGEECAERDIGNGVRRELDTSEYEGRGEIDWDTDSDSDDSAASGLVADLAALSLKVQHAKDESVSRPPSTKNAKKNGAMKKQDLSDCSSAAHGVTKAQSEHRSQASGGHNTQLLESYYVEVGEEPERTKPVLDDSALSLLMSKYENDEKTRVGSGISETWETEKEEQESAALESFEVFQDRISRAPEQILRYRFDSKPIWPKYPPPRMESKPNCECGLPLVFEVQVLGSCLHYLQPDKSVDPHRKEAGMNFAAVAIYTCQADCTSSEILANSPSFKMFRQTVVIQQDDW